jgi:hypothetical protein
MIENKIVQLSDKTKIKKKKGIVPSNRPGLIAITATLPHAVCCRIMYSVLICVEA